MTYRKLDAKSRFKAGKKTRKASLVFVNWKCCMYSCSLFCSLPLIFTLGAASISHFLTAAIKFSCYSYDEVGLLCFLSLASSFSVIHVSLDIEIKSKERIGFVVVIFSLKVRVAMLFTAETRGYLKCRISIRLT